MTWYWAHDFIAFTPTATTEATNFVDDRMAAIDDHPYLHTWRSTVTTVTSIVLDFGSDKGCAGLALFNLNVKQVELHWGTAAGPGYTAFDPGPFFSVSQNKPGPYYNLFVLQGFVGRYIRIRFPAATPLVDTSETYYSLGLAVPLAVAHRMPSLPRAGMTEKIQGGYLRSGTHVALNGPRWSEETWSLRIDPNMPSALGSWQDLIGLGEHTSIVIAQDGGSQQVKLMRRSAAATFTRDHAHYDVNPTFREHV